MTQSEAGSIPFRTREESVFRFGGLSLPAGSAPLLAAFLVFLSALPALILVPPLDRDESRFAEASAQMLETSNFVDIRYQSEPRDKKPVGIHWLQAASVRLLSSVESRRIWAYRIPSILGAMLAAAACAWGAGLFFGASGAFASGAAMGASFLLSSEAFIAKTDAVLCGATTLCMAALARLYLASREGPPAGRAPRVLFWGGIALGLLVKGPVTPMVAGLALLALWVVDRRAAWMRSLGWGWGLILVLLVVGPWAAAITVDTDGSFWTGAIGGDLAPKLAGGHETHGAPFGLHLLLLPLLMFPASLLLPAAGVAALRGRRATGVRFALAWLSPSWFVFELLPTKLVHYTLPLYGAVGWLIAAAVSTLRPECFGIRARAAGAALSVLVGLVLAAATLVLVNRYPAPGLLPPALLTAVLLFAAGAYPAALLLRNRPRRALVAATALGVASHMAITGAVAPQVSAFWTSQRAARSLKAHGLDPRSGLIEGPVAVAGYAEPSLVFLLGTSTELDTPEDAAESLAEGQAALVEKRVEPAFLSALKAQGAAAAKVDVISGFDYSTGKPVSLGLWRRVSAPPGRERAP